MWVRARRRWRRSLPSKWRRLLVGHVALFWPASGPLCRRGFFAVLRRQLSAASAPHPACRARTSSPCVIFFDEIDGLVSMRDSNGDHGVRVGERMLSQLLQEMDGLQVLYGRSALGWQLLPPPCC